MLVAFTGTASAVEGPGTTGAEVLEFGDGARAAGMGGAQTALVDDDYSLNLNPAGLAFMHYQEASFMENLWVEGINQQTALYAYPSLRWGTVGGEVTRLSVGTVQGYDATGLAVGNVTGGDYVVTAGYADTLGPIAYGVALMGIQETLDTVSAQTYAANLGLQAHQDTPWARLGEGLAVLNLGPGLKFDSALTPLPQEEVLGLSATRVIYGDPCSLDVDVSYPIYATGPQYAVGAEAGIMGILALRAGYQSQQDIGTGLSLGFGFKAKDLRFDYAYFPMGDFGSANRFGVTFRWGEPVSVSRDRDRIALARAYQERGKEYLDQKRYLDALKEFQQALELDPLDKDTLKLMRQAYDGMRQ